MKRINFRKLVLALADIFIIVISAIVSNYLLSLFGAVTLASRELLYVTVVDLLVCTLFMFASGVYSRLWRYLILKTTYYACVLCSQVFASVIFLPLFLS